ncbi:hypothetical protein MXB_2223 [Myxobolus squamalis]|nr:hypothetical protein MXB_2223 [Myxobolus squamalis]
MQERIKTIITIKASQAIIVYKQHISLTDKLSGKTSTFETIFCDCSAKEKCEKMDPYILQFSGGFTLGKKFSMVDFEITPTTISRIKKRDVPNFYNNRSSSDYNWVLLPNSSEERKKSRSLTGRALAANNLHDF